MAAWPIPWECRLDSGEVISYHGPGSIVGAHRLRVVSAPQDGEKVYAEVMYTEQLLTAHEHDDDTERLILSHAAGIHAIERLRFR